MNRFAEEYASKKVTIQDVLHMIQSNDLIWSLSRSSGNSTP